MLPGRGDVDATGGPAVSASVHPRYRERWRDRVCTAALAVAAFGLHLWLALRLDRLGLFERFNTLFGADPNLRLESLRRSDALFRLPHPGLSYLLGIPIRALGRLVATIVPGDPAPDRVVRAIALGVAPLAAALQCLILLRLFRRLGFAFGAAFALTLLSALSFSAIIFGSMPETYAVSALAIAVAYALFLWSRERRGFGTEISWLAVGVFASGVTITNILPVAVLYFLRGVRGSGRPGIALARTVGIAALATFVAAAAGFAADELLRVRKTPAPSEREWIARYIVQEPLAHFATFPTAIVNGIAPPAPTRVPGFSLQIRPNAGPGRLKAAPSEDPADPGGAPEDPAPPKTVPDGGADRPPVRGPNARLARLTLQPSHGAFSLRNLAGIALVAALVWAALRRGGADPALTSLARASLVIVGFNWALHGFWGGETFLYSQHWHVSIMFLVAALAAAVGRGGRATVALLAGSIVAVAASSLVALSKVLSLFAGP